MHCFKKTISKWNEKEEIAKLLNLSLDEVEKYIEFISTNLVDFFIFYYHPCFSFSKENRIKHLHI